MPAPRLCPLRHALALLLAALATPALADLPGNSIADEVGVASSQSTPDAPRSGQVSESLWAVLDLGGGWALDLSAGITSIEATKGILGREFGSRGATVLDFGSGLSWEASDHVMLGVSFDLSPSAKLFNDTRVAFTTLAGQTAVADALLEAATRMTSAALLFSYDTAGDSDFESAVDAGVGVNHFDTSQRLVAMRGPAGTVVTSAELLNQCQMRRCSRQLLGLLRERPASVNQVEARVAITETVWEDTDIGLGGSWFVYDRDPTEVGFFSLMSAGRGPVALGSGVALAPLQWRIRPEVAHRFGDLVVKLWLAHGAYVSGEGTSNVLGTRLQVRFARSFRMWLSASRQRDTDAGGNSAAFNQVALGAMLLF